jgi:hypothetical protein
LSLCGLLGAPKLDPNRNDGGHQALVAQVDTADRRWVDRTRASHVPFGNKSRLTSANRVSSSPSKERNKILAEVRLIGTKLSIQRLNISCRKLESAGRQTNMLWVPGMTV